MLDSHRLTKGQFCSIDALLLQLDRFDAEQPVRQNSDRHNICGGGLKVSLSVRHDCRGDSAGMDRFDEGIRAVVENLTAQAKINK
ncbi:hypothetical protein [Paraburkholderia solitsugae]|uniref:hypothetical protein n=1 Tax=Paraburkholderia solitsugae TaxID=2675748 RepID=UPI001C12E144|nr:hypothetical protein [Paraburkholderia solitsugae]